MCRVRVSRASASSSTCEFRLRLPSIASLKIWIARASAPISSVRAVWGTSTLSAPSATCLMVAVMTESGRAIERAMIRTPTTTTASARPPRQVKRNASWRLASVGIDLRQRFEILVQSRPHLAVGVIVAPLAARGRIDLDAAADQFLPELDELFDALLEGCELLGIVGLHEGFPVLDHGQDLVVELEQPG